MVWLPDSEDVGILVGGIVFLFQEVDRRGHERPGTCPILPTNWANFQALRIRM